jgi:universal stress protein A
MKRILCPTDFSGPAADAERKAAGLAGALGAELVLLHVTSEAPLWGETLYTPKVRAVFDSQRRWAADALAARVAALAGAGVTARAVVTTGVAWRQIVKAATDEKADVIVIGTHGRTGLDRILLGSVAERVLRHATCPVLTVRPGSIDEKKRGAA